MQVVNSKGWAVLVEKIERDKNIKEVDYIQTGVRHRAGKGISYEFKFLAPLNESSPEATNEEIFYNFKELGDDLQLLEQGCYEEFCRKQILKMCYYIKQTKKLEIL